MVINILRCTAFLALAPSVEGQQYNAKSNFHAVGDGSHDDTTAVQNAFDALREHPGSSLYFPAGTYKVGVIKMAHLTNNKITHDTQASFIPQLKGWNCCSEGHFEQWVHAKHWEGVTYEGGNWKMDRQYWIDNPGGHGRSPPMLWIIDDFHNAKIDGLQMSGAGTVHMKVRGSEHLDFRNMKLHTGYPTSGTDGIQLATVSHACLDNIDIINGDDCLKVMDSTSDVTFSNSRCQGGHGLTVGGGGRGLKIQDVRWVNTTCVDMRTCARIKWEHATGGYVKNIVYEGITMVNVEKPIDIDANYHGGDEKEKMEVGDLHYKDITATYDGKNRNPGIGGWPMDSGSTPQSPRGFHSIGFSCTSKRPCSKIHMHNVHVQTGSSWHCEHCSGDTDNNVSPKAPSSLKTNSDSRRRTSSPCAGHGPTPVPPPSPSPSPSPTPSPSPSPGGCTLVNQLSQTSCILGSNFGCENGKAWTNGGCRAQITCPTGELTTCNDKDTQGRQECNCGSSCGSSIKPDDDRRRRSPSPPPDDGRRRSSDERRRRTRRRSAEEEVYTV